MKGKLNVKYALFLISLISFLIFNTSYVFAEYEVPSIEAYYGTSITYHPWSVVDPTGFYEWFNAPTVIDGGRSVTANIEYLRLDIALGYAYNSRDYNVFVQDSSSKIYNIYDRYYRATGAGNHYFSYYFTAKVTGTTRIFVCMKQSDTQTTAFYRDVYLVVPDTTPPSLTITANPTANPTNASSITYTFTFSEPVTGFDTSDITVTNGTKGTFTTVSTSVYTLVVTNTGSTTQTVSVAAGRCTDLAGNNNTAANISVTIDRTAPTAAITYSPVGPYKSGTVVTITATFTEVMKDSPIPRIAISGANTLAATNMTKISTTVYRYTHTVGVGNGTATVALSTGQDAVGNVVTATPTSGATFTVDNTVPTAAITYSPVGPYKSGTVVTITATFNEVMKDSPIPRIAISGANTLAATNMTKISTTVYRYTHTVGAGNGTATIALSTGQDNAGNVVTATPTSGATFIVDNTQPNAPTFVANPNNSTLTNGNVNVTINYPADANVRQYKIGSGGAWTSYTAPVNMTSNGSIFARGTDLAGNTSAESSISITNIAAQYNNQLVSENIPTTMEAGNAYPVTIVVKNIGKETWSEANNHKLGGVGDSDPFASARQLIGSQVVAFDNNATFTFNMIAPNTTGTYTTDWAMVREGYYWFPTIISKNVTVVDTTPPTNPTFVATPNNSTPTNGNVTVTITYSGDSVTQQYKIDSGEWINYTTDVVITSNATIYARAVDAVGNENTSASLSITNIDKTPPTITLTPSIIIPTNQNITVTADITDNISGVDVKKWASGNQTVEYFLTNGTALDTSFEVSENGTYTAYAKDIVGNEAVKTILIENIDKEAPGVPEFILSTTLPTDKVTVTIKFPDGSHTKEYKIGDGSWENYTEPLQIHKNITIYAKCADMVGNTTGDTSLNIGNIEVNGSVEGIELDDRKYFRYYLGLGKNNITQCMLVAGNENGNVKRNFVRDDVIDSETNKFKDGIFYINIYGKIKRY